MIDIIERTQKAVQRVVASIITINNVESFDVQTPPPPLCLVSVHGRGCPSDIQRDTASGGVLNMGITIPAELSYSPALELAPGCRVCCTLCMTFPTYI